MPRGSSAPPRTPHARFAALRREPRQTLLHQRPRTFGRPTRVWTLPRAAEVAVAEGMTPRPVSGEAMRQALVTRKTRWNRATHGLTSPDPAYVRHNNSAPDSSGGRPRTRTGRVASRTKGGGVASPRRPCPPGPPLQPPCGWSKKRARPTTLIPKPWRVTDSWGGHGPCSQSSAGSGAPWANRSVRSRPRCSPGAVRTGPRAVCAPDYGGGTTPHGTPVSRGAPGAAPTTARSHNGEAASVDSRAGGRVKARG